MNLILNVSDYAVIINGMEFYEVRYGGIAWDVHFRRPPGDWQIAKVVECVALLESIKITEEEDKTVCSSTKDCMFFVKSFHFRLIKAEQSSQRTPGFPWKTHLGKKNNSSGMFIYVGNFQRHKNKFAVPVSVSSREN